MNALIIGALVAVFVIFVLLIIGCRSPSIDITQFPRKFPDEQGDHYDVIIVGAGPAGSTLSYYLAKYGRRVLLLEKKAFPRDKYCGDAICKTAIEILKDMGLLNKILDNKLASVADSGGLCSPSGYSYIGRSKEAYGEIPAALACKRIVFDEVLARAAQESGATLLENHSVKGASLDKSSGLWTVELEGSDVTYQGRVLVCADGAPSTLATKLGIVTTAPQGSCSRAYVEKGTHRFKADGVVFYNKLLLPGYAALFKNINDELNYCCYIIPGNPKVTNDDLPYWHDYIMKNEPHLVQALGKNYKIERMRAASLRFGGEKRSYADHVILCGDAAGMIDPMTGEGIHHAMESGKIAAKFLDEAFKVGNFDASVMEEYHNRWMNRFGSDFKWSAVFTQLLYRYPILLDAATNAIIRKGDKYLLKWADIMTGRIPKFHLLKPEFVIVVTYELIVLLLKQIMFRHKKEHEDKKN